MSIKDILSTRNDDRSPRNVLTRDFPKYKWSIDGGWGYSASEATCIDIEDKWDAIAMEDRFALYRTYEDLIVKPDDNHRYRDIRIQRGWQELKTTPKTFGQQRYIDIVHYLITAQPDEDNTDGKALRYEATIHFDITKALNSNEDEEI